MASFYYDVSGYSMVVSEKCKVLGEDRLSGEQGEGMQAYMQIMHRSVRENKNEK